MPAADCALVEAALGQFKQSIRKHAAFVPVTVQHFEDILRQNGGSAAAPGHLVGASITAADLAVYHYLAAAEQHYK
jgi:hypothetical protein